MKYNKSEIMKAAWNTVWSTGATISAALKLAWAAAKAEIAATTAWTAENVEKTVAAFEAAGFNRWTKAGYDRLYVNAETLGLKITRYNTGNVSGAWWQGELISNNWGRQLLSAKTYIDVKTGKIGYTNETLLEAARTLRNSILAKLA